MKFNLTILIYFLIFGISFGQNQNISMGNVFDGEPFLAIKPNNSQQLVIAWMGYVGTPKIAIKTSSSFDGGQTWSPIIGIAHVAQEFGSADPSLSFDANGNVFLSYIDYDKDTKTGAIYIRKSIDNGLHWGNAVHVIDATDDPDHYPIDRPWMCIDQSGSAYDGNIYITSISPKNFGNLNPPFHPYITRSINNGNSFNTWQFLDNTNWLSGDNIQQPMPTNCVSTDGILYAVYPSYVTSQNIYPQYILASSSDGGSTFTYHSVLIGTHNVSSNLAKKGYLILSDPSHAQHLSFFYLAEDYGDIDVFMCESFDAGLSWSQSVRINDDPIGNDRMQDLLWADFDDDGDLAVAWRDRRNAPSNTYETSYEIWGSIKEKNTSNFSRNFRISDRQIDYNPILANSGNDFMSLKMKNDSLYAAWGDTRNGKMNIWFQSLDNTNNALTLPKNNKDIGFKIFPNPSNTSIRITGKSIREINIFSIDGQQIIHQNYYKPTDNVLLNIDKLANTSYFIFIKGKESSTTQKFIKK